MSAHTPSMSDKNFTLIIAILNIVFGLLATIGMSLAAYALNNTVQNSQQIAVMLSREFTNTDAERLKADLKDQNTELDKRLQHIEDGVEKLLAKEN